MQESLIELILSTMAVLIILSIHEFSHALAACKLGDNTAKYMGRLTVNPMKHLDPIGALCMIFLRFGWAKPVPVNLRNLKKPKRDFAIIALAGPISNLIMAFVSAFIYLLLLAIFRRIEFSTAFTYNLADYTLLFVYIFHIINVGVAIFNLIPVPPLDGSRLLGAVLPPKAYIKVLKNEQKIYFILLAWLFIGDFASRMLLRIPIVSSVPVLSFLAEFISLSNILSYVTDLISTLMMSFWQLIPFLKI